MLRWGPIRLDSVFTDWNSTPSPKPQANVQQGRKESYPQIECVKMVTIRDMKRNAFPASHLKTKAGINLPVSTPSKKGNLCGRSLIDISRKQSLLLKYARDLRCDKKGIRRPLSERRKDWNVAMSDVVGQDWRPTHLVSQASISFPYPVLVSGLKCNGTEGLVLLGATTRRLELKPKGNMAIANVISNLWFDAELLSTNASDAMQKICCASSGSKMTFANGLNHFQFLETTQHHSIFTEANSAGSEEIETPIVSNTHIEAFQRMGKSRSNVAELGKNDFFISFSEVLLADLERSPKTVQFSDPDIDLFLMDYRISLDQHCASVEIMEDSLRGLVTDEESIHLDSITFSLERTSRWEDFEMPVVPLGLLNDRSNHILRLVEHPIWPAGRKATVCASSLDDISEHVRDRYSYEIGYWCSGSREILKKSQYLRSQLLRRVPSLSLAVIAESLKPLKGRDSVLFGSFQLLERSEELFTILRGTVRKKTFPSKRWQKFAQALMADLDEERISLENRRVERIRDGMDSYDPPKRRRSSACGELIESMYSCTQKNRTCESPTRSNLQGSQGVNGDEEQSGESILDDLLLSEDEDVVEDRPRAAALGTLIGLGNENGKQKNKETLDRRISGNKHVCFQTTSSHLIPHDYGNERVNSAQHLNPVLDDSEVRLRTPCNMVCSPSSLKIAEHCLQHLKRGVVFIPPPLSLLPTLAIVACSFLSASLLDHRVLIICEPGTDIVPRVASYLEFTYGGGVSVDTVRRDECERLPRLASLAKKMARIVITDSFEFMVPAGFALLIVLGPGATSWNSIKLNSPASETEVSSSVANWGTIPSVLVLPHHPCNTLIGYSRNVNVLATRLGLTEALFVEDRDDIHHLTLLSRPDVLFLVPPHEVSDLVATLETHASPYFTVYRNLKKHKNRGASLRDIHLLREVNVVILESFLALEHLPHGAGTVDDLEILYSLRQARSYALYDGYETAIAYLEHYARRATSQTLSVLQSVLEEVHNLQNPTKKKDSQSHPMTTALGKSFERMEADMLGQAPSLQSIHRRYQFRPLVITNSKEAYDGLLKSLDMAKDILEARERDVALCELRHLWGTTGKTTGYEHQAQEISTNFSHVYHVIDDRNRQSHSDTLPPHLLQYVHAGRTRLLTIVVDETRALESIHRHHEVLYADLSAALEAAGTPAQQQHLRKDAYMKHVSLRDVISSLNNLVSSSERVVKETSPATNCVTGTQAVVATCERSAKRARTPQKSITKISELHISVTEICQSSIAGLRSILKTKLDSIRHQKNQGTLDVFIKIGACERCTPATTYIFAAVAGNVDLFNHTKVRTVFQY